MMGPLAIPMMIASTAMQAVGAIQAGNAQAAQYQAQAQANEYNARVQRQQAEAVAQQTSAKEDLQRRQARAVVGQQMAATAQSGVNLNGTASDLLRQSLIDAETDALNIRYEGEMNRTGLLNDANLQQWEAGVNRSNAKTARRAGYLNAATAIVGGGYEYTKMKPTAGLGANPAGGLKVGGGTGLRYGGLRAGGG